MTRKARTKQGRKEAAKPKTSRLRKLAIAAGVAAGILSGLVHFRQPHRFLEPSLPQSFLKTRYAAEAMPITRKVKEMVKSGALTLSREPINEKGTEAYYSSEKGVLSVPKPPNTPRGFMTLTHESMHVLQDQYAPTRPLYAFLRKEKAVTEKGATPVQDFPAFLRKFVEEMIPKERQEEFTAENGRVDEQKALVELTRQIQEDKEAQRPRQCLQEMHANLFDERGSFNEKNWYHFFKSTYAKESRDLTYEKFLKIKQAILTLYHLNPQDPHDGIAKAIGQHGESFEEFLSHAGKQAKKHNVTPQDVQATDAKRRATVAELQQAIGNEQEMKKLERQLGQ